MEVNKEVIFLFKKYPLIDKIKFGVLNLNRVVNLYTYKNLDSLKHILINLEDFLIANNNEFNSSKIKITLQELLQPNSYDDSDEFILASLVVTMFDSLINFIEKKEDKCIEKICDSLINIVNVCASVQFRNKKVSGNFKNKREFVLKQYENEICIEKDLLIELKNNISFEILLSKIKEFNIII